MIKVQGSQLYIQDGTELFEVGCVTDLGEIPVSRNSQDATPLGAEFTKTQATTITLGAISVSVNFSSTRYSDQKIRSLFLSNTPIKVFIGLSENADQPSISSGVVSLPAMRTWVRFDGEVRSYPLSFPSDDVVGMSFDIQLQSMPLISFAGGTSWQGGYLWNGDIYWR